MTRIAGFLADHYAKYYDELNPPLNRGSDRRRGDLARHRQAARAGVHPVEAKYTTEGCLIGHVLMGRDMVREAARKIEGFPTELLLHLEHAILAHHGKREFGSPVVPQTIEALIVSYIDELDAKMNIMARESMDSQDGDAFTERVYALDNRRFYKGVPEEGSSGDRQRIAAGLIDGRPGRPIVPAAPPPWRPRAVAVRIVLEIPARTCAPRQACSINTHEVRQL